MATARKQFTFDLKTDKDSPLYNYYNTFSKAYHDIEKYMQEHGCIHRQGSSYISEKAMSQKDVVRFMDGLCRELPWLSECLSGFDVTDIGKQHGLLDDIREMCEAYSNEKEKWQESFKDGGMKKHLLDINDYKQAPMFAALIELNERLKEEGISGIELNVVGGFAMMSHGLRESDGYTDIDYVGDNLPKRVADIADDIGFKYHLGRHWINNDVLLAGATLEDLEFTTGKLHFQEAFELETMKINILETPDLLKMKVMAIDTSLSAVELGDGDFTRAKDFNDIIKLKDALSLSTANIKEMMGDKLLSGYTVKAIKAFEMGGIDEVRRSILPKVVLQNKQLYEGVKTPEYTRTSYIDQVLERAGIGKGPRAPTNPDKSSRSSSEER